MSSANIRELLTSFSPSLDFFAISTGDGRIKIWDTLKGQLQTEFADIASNDASDMQTNERGHLSLDYKCTKWIQLERKKKKKTSLLVLGTGSGDVLALDVALGQLKWKISDCHPGGVTAVSNSGHNSCIYTAGVDGMVCQIDCSSGKSIGKFKASTKTVSALSLSPDGKLLATASAQLKIFNCSNNKKTQKISGHPVAVRCMVFSEDGKYILSSAPGEKSVAIWKKIDDRKYESASCILSMEHPAIFLDTKCSDSEGIYILAISEMGICYFWHATTFEELQTSKPSKFSLSNDTSQPKHNKGLTVFAAKCHHIISTSSLKTLVVYGNLVKPSFQKITMEYGKDMVLNASQDGVLLPIDSGSILHKSHVSQTKVTALDRANAEDAILPLPKLYDQEKKRKHTTALVSDTKNSAEPPKTWDERAEVLAHIREKDGITSFEDRLRKAGILGAKDNIPDSSVEATVDFSGHLPIDANMPIKKVRSKILSMKPKDAYKLLESCYSSWKARSASSQFVLPWIYHILVIHGQFITSQESSKQLVDGFHKMTRIKCECIQPLLNLSGSMQLIMAQIDKASAGEEGMVLNLPAGDNNSDASDDEDDEEIDELVYREEDNTSQSDTDNDNKMR